MVFKIIKGALMSMPILMMKSCKQIWVLLTNRQNSSGMLSMAGSIIRK
jgi:hypothetical protein